MTGRARDPHIEEREKLIRDADGLLSRYEGLLQSPLQDRVEEIGSLWLREARSLYERAGAATSRDPVLRLKYASVLEESESYAEQAATLEGLLKTDPPALYAAEAWRELAIAYARMSRHREEITAHSHRDRMPIFDLSGF